MTIGAGIMFHIVILQIDMNLKFAYYGAPACMDFYILQSRWSFVKMLNTSDVLQIHTSSLSTVGCISDLGNRSNVSHEHVMFGRN